LGSNNFPTQLHFNLTTWRAAWREKETGGQGNWETGCSLMRDKRLAQRNDSGLEEEQMIKKISNKRNYRAR
jgi:hypothetical protein